MQVAGPAMTGHDLDLLARSSRGRNRSASEAFPPSREPDRDVEEPAQIPKAASYTYFPKVKNLELAGTISEEELKETAQEEADSSCSSSNGSSPSSEETAEVEQLPQLRPAPTRRASRFFPSFSSKSREPSAERKGSRSRYENVKDADSPSISPVRSLTKLRRKSWIASSREQSPSKEVKTDGTRRNTSGPDTAKRRSMTGGLSIPDRSKPKHVAADAPATKARVLTKKAKRPLSGIFSSSTTPAPLAEPEEKTQPQLKPQPQSQPKPKSAVPIPPVPAVPKSFSTERLPSFTQSPTSPTHIPPLPRNVSAEKLKGVRTEPRKKDELWTVFRTLEADLRRFQAKSLALKANVVRTTLLPFLRSYAVHASNHQLRPEDLDRRINILNGWWTGLLELLAGRNNQSISGTDRPAILDGIAGVMERPEWRLSPSPFCALADRAETSSTSTTKSDGSASSTSSDFLAESVYHNVRNIFTQNLLSQMTFVVDKMALRNAAASLVTFCGKTCAYAFCFCPGVADVLVRLWNPTLELMKRVLEESGVSRQDRLDGVSDRIAQSFPPLLHSLKFQSLAKLLRILRRPAPLPLGTANLDWFGSWVKRWSGAESDLFYVFVKHFHILVTDFLPIEPSHAERVCVPGLVLVHAQILYNLDATVNRHASPQQPEESMGASAITFDDVLGEPDASATTIPMPPANATRQMAENRLIMLIRDFLSERNAHLSTARRIFAESFGRLLKAAARKVSIYDNNACYTLCDFLEEAFVILVRYEQLDTQHHCVLDWPFWLLVCKQMAASQNTATEIKLYAFLYSTWSTVATDTERKRALCLDFILEPDFFESRFNHWCPMVRAYFMRLLCWRVARFDDDSDSEMAIMKALSDRLRSVWSHYLWLREEADARGGFPPSTAPCNPAPSRRFLIIRNDNPMVTSNGPFLSFDGVIQSPMARKSPIDLNPDVEARPASSASIESQDFPDEETTKGRWGILKNIIGTSKQAAKAKAAAASRKESGKETSAPAHDAPVRAAPQKATPTPSPPPRPPAPTHRSYSFRFALEWVDKRYATFQNMRLNPPRLPLPAQFLLQTKGINLSPATSHKPTGAAMTSSRYAGRSLAEWTFISHECQNFFDRRKNEGVPNNKLVETPTLAVEAFRRPG